MNEKSVSRGFALLSAANIFAKALSLIYIPFLLKIIHENGYGIYFAAYNIYVLFYIITITGFSIAIPKMISEFTANSMFKEAQASFDIGKKIMTYYGFIMAVIFALTAYPISIYINYKESFFPILFLAPAIFFASLGCSYRGYFQGVQDIKPFAVAQIIEQLVNIIFTLLLAYILSKKSLALGCAGGTAGTVLAAFSSFIYLKAYYEKHRTIPNETERTVSNWDIFRRILKYSIPVMISSGIPYLATNLIDVSNISNRLAHAGFSYYDRTVAYACYAKYNQLLNIPFIVISSLAVAILPLITKYYTLNDFNNLQEKTKYIFKVVFLISIPSAVGLSTLSKPIFIMIFGNTYSNGSKLMLYGAAVIIFMSVSQIQATILQSMGKLYFCTISSILGVIIKIICNYIFIGNPKINIYGTLIGSFMCYLIPSILNNSIIKKHTKIKSSLLSSWIKPFISSVLMCPFVIEIYKLVHFLCVNFTSQYINNLISLLISIYVGTVVYIFSLVKLKGITESDLDLIPKKIRKVVLPTIKAG